MIAALRHGSIPLRARVTKFLCESSLLVALSLAGPAHAAFPGYQYLSPVPESHLVRVATNLIIRPGPAIDPATVSADRVLMVGAASGAHSGQFALSDDGTSLIFTPFAPFAAEEAVTVTLLPGVKTQAGDDLPPLSYQFFTSPETSGGTPGRATLDRLSGALTSPRDREEAGEEQASSDGMPQGTRPASAIDSPLFTPCGGLPTSYPTVTVIRSQNPDPGNIFMAPFLMASAPAPYGHLQIVDNAGYPIFWRKPSYVRPGLFKLLPNGLLSYIGTTATYLMDSAYTVVDSFTTGNGYSIDGHEFQLLPNGHVLLMAYDPEPVRMDSVVPGGQPGAIVDGLVLQELDLARRVVFQWRSWDYMSITDCNSSAVDLQGYDVDYVHGNSIELDTDGNWLISSRHMSEITKIDRATGEIRWRLGPHALRNEFTILDDGRGFSHQHDVRRLPNGHISLLDNGIDLSPLYSRALEYDVDEINKTARLVWEYRTTPDTFGGYMGNVQHRAGGGVTIDWGGNMTSALRVSELHPDGSVALELGLKARTISYQAFRFPWKTTICVPQPESLEFTAAPLVGGERSMHAMLRNRATRSLTLTCYATTHPAFKVATSFPIALGAGDSADVDVRYDTTYPGPVGGRIYLRAVSDTEIVSVPIEAKYSFYVGVDGGDATTALRFALHEARPNPFRHTASFTFDLPNTSKVRLEVFDVHGRKVDTVVDGTQRSGRHEVTWTPVRAPDGVYFCRLSAGDFHATRRLVRLQ